MNATEKAVEEARRDLEYLFCLEEVSNGELEETIDKYKNAAILQTLEAVEGEMAKAITIWECRGIVERHIVKAKEA